MATINVNGHHIDAVSQKEGGYYFVEDASESDYLLIHFVNRPTSEEVAALVKLEVHLLDLVSDNTYLCYYRHSNLQRIRSLSFVGFANVYHTDFVIQPTYRDQLGQSDATPNVRIESPEESIMCHIRIHENADLSKAKHQIAKVAKVQTSSLSCSKFGVMSLQLQFSQIPQIAALDSVRTIEPQTTKVHKIFQAERVLGRIEQRYKDFATADRQNLCRSLDGSGEFIVILDSGLELGQGHQVPPAFGRRIREWKSYNTAGTTADKNGHGTAVAACVAADGTSKQFADVHIRGSAPGAELIIKNHSTSDGFAIKNLTAAQELSQLEDLMAVPPVKNTPLPRVENLSYGEFFTGAQNDYTNSALTLDSSVWNNPDFVYVQAAGNEGLVTKGDGQIVGMTAAKNIIAVGGCENLHDLKVTEGYKYGTEQPIAPGDPDQMYVLSNRGPTKEGRVKPDVVAPAAVVYTQKSSLPDLLMTQISSNPARFDETFNGDNSRDPTWIWITGTSFSAPFVSGLCATIRQMYLKRYGLYPSAAMVKALLVHGASIPDEVMKEMNTNAGKPATITDGPVPKLNHNSWGFGRVNKFASLVPLYKDIGAYVLDTLFFLPDFGFSQKDFDAAKKKEIRDTLDEFALTKDNVVFRDRVIKPEEAGRTLIATLAWTDYPGPTLNNKLALRVVEYSDESKRKGSFLAEADPNDRKKPVVINNVQKIMWVGVKPKYTYRVKVEFYDGVVSTVQNDPKTKQHFALVCHIDPPLP